MKRIYSRTARKRLSQEQGTIYKEWGSKISVALVYPNVYSVGMSNLGFLKVYSLFNRHQDVVCERTFMPDWKELQELIRTGEKIVSLESGKALDSFEIIAFSLYY